MESNPPKVTESLSKIEALFVFCNGFCLPFKHRPGEFFISNVYASVTFSSCYEDSS